MPDRWPEGDEGGLGDAAPDSSWCSGIDGEDFMGERELRRPWP